MRRWVHGWWRSQLGGAAPPGRSLPILLPQDRPPGLGFMIFVDFYSQPQPVFPSHTLTGRLISGAGGGTAAGFPADDHHELLHRHRTLHRNGHDAGWLSVGIGLGSAALPLAGSWRMAMAATAVLSGVALVGVAVVLVGGPGSAVETKRGLRLGVRELASVIAAGAVWGCLNAGFAVLLGSASVFFVDQGLSARDAGVLVSLTAFATVPMSLFCVLLLSRLPRSPTGYRWRHFTQHQLPDSAAAIGYRTGSSNHLGWSGARRDCGSYRGAAGSSARAEHRAVGMGVFWLTFFILMTVLPPFAGLARDLTGAVTAPLCAAAAFTTLALPALIAYVGMRRPAITAVDAG